MWTLIIVMWGTNNVFMPTVQIGGFETQKTCISWADKNLDKVLSTQANGEYTCINMN